MWTQAPQIGTGRGRGVRSRDALRASGENRHLEAALRLIDEVHHTLGRHRADDARRGWISGLTAAEGEAHPTEGGLRIGKPLPERGPDEPFDERREWDRDGQYFHYATKWMHALDQTARAVGQPIFNTWARELALAAHRGFTHIPRRVGTRRMLDILDRICTGQGRKDDLESLESLARSVRLGSICGLGKTAPNPVLSTLKYFRHEYEAHLEGRCPAGKCQELIAYKINTRCIGCTLCAQHCPADAIPMTPYQRHTINNETCTRCDTCREICPTGAVYVE